MKHSGYVVRGDLSRFSKKSPDAPLGGHLDMELTERCNNDCIHCSINRAGNDCEAREKELKTREWKDLLLQAAELGVLSVRFTGGEPLLREDFVEIYRFARNLGLKVILFTNARLITSQLAGLFSKIPPLGKIEISVYGISRKSYEAVSGINGSFQEFSRGLAYLSEQGVPFMVKSVLLPPNRDEMENFQEWAGTLPGQNYLPMTTILFDLRGRRDSVQKNRRIKRLRLPPEEVLKLLARDASRYRKVMASFCRQFMGMGIPGDKIFICGAGRSGCVDAYGWFQPCLLMRDPRYCHDLKNGSLREAWSSQPRRLARLKARNPDYLNRCARCFLKGLCEQCPARSWSEHGSPDTPVEYLCRLAHVQARFLGLIRVDEKAWTVEDGGFRIQNWLQGQKSGERHSAAGTGWPVQ